MNNLFNKRIAKLRLAMQQYQIDAYIIPSSDPHQSEYVAERWKSRAWISGFTGSAGTVVITSDHAGVWTDSRYFIQAEQELKGSDTVLHKLTIPHTAQHLSWLKEHLPKGATVGFDGKCFSMTQVRQLAQALYDNDVNLKGDIDLIEKIWDNRPALPPEPIFELSQQYAGESRTNKIARIRDAFTAIVCTHHLITTLDDIAWVFNIRARDVQCNPVAVAFAIITASNAILFIDTNKVSTELKAQFIHENIQLKPYHEIENYLSNLFTDDRILIDPKRINNNLFNAIPEDCRIHGKTISTALKAVKNTTEIGHIRQAMIKDGIALTKLYRWLDNELDTRTVSEVEVAQQLHRLRSEQDNFFGDSFDAIVGFRGNGAIVHYRAEPNTCAQIEKNGILLIDSGGQYLEGTTDITRTTALGTPTPEQKQNFTLVLKGNIAIDQLQFPHGTHGGHIDVLARMHLWKYGLSYGHGTGHGVGYFLNVHEGPQSIGPRSTGVPFEEGMVTSNEPGFYKKSEYGIRIENLILTKKAVKNEFGQFLSFETLTLFPIDQKLIATNLLEKAEIEWLNDYHAKVYNTLAPYLNDDEQLWMKERCQALKI